MMSDDTDAYIDVVGLSGDQDEAFESIKSTENEAQDSQICKGNSVESRSEGSVHTENSEHSEHKEENGISKSMMQESIMPCCSTSNFSEEADSHQSSVSLAKRFAPINPKLEQDSDIIFLGHGRKDASELLACSSPFVKSHQSTGSTWNNGRTSVSSPAISSTTEMNSEVLAEMMHKIDKLYEQLQELQGQGGQCMRSIKKATCSTMQRDADSPTYPEARSPCRNSGIDAELLMNDRDEAHNANIVVESDEEKEPFENHNSTENSGLRENCSGELTQSTTSCPNQSVTENSRLRDNCSRELTLPTTSCQPSSKSCESLRQKNASPRTETTRNGKRKMAEISPCNIAKRARISSSSIPDDDDAASERSSEPMSIVSYSPGVTPTPTPTMLRFSTSTNSKISLPQSLPATPLFSPAATPFGGSDLRDEESALRRRAKSLSLDPVPLPPLSAVTNFQQRQEQLMLQSTEASSNSAVVMRGTDVLQAAFNSAMAERSCSVASTSDSSFSLATLPTLEPLFRTPVAPLVEVPLPTSVNEKGRPKKPRKRKVDSLQKATTKVNSVMQNAQHPPMPNMPLPGNPAMAGVQLTPQAMTLEQAGSGNGFHALQDQLRAGVPSLPLDRAVIVQVEQQYDRGISLAPGNIINYSGGNSVQPPALPNGANIHHFQREFCGKMVYSAGADESTYIRTQIGQSSAMPMFHDDRLLGNPPSESSSAAAPRASPLVGGPQSQQLVATPRPIIISSPHLGSVMVRPPQSTVLIGGSPQFPNAQLYGQNYRALSQASQVPQQPTGRSNVPQAYAPQSLVPALSAAPFIVSQSQSVAVNSRLQSPYGQQMNDCVRAPNPLIPMQQMHPSASSLNTTLLKEHSQVLCVPQAETISFPPGVEKTITKVRNTACVPSPESSRDHSLPRRAPDHRNSSIPTVLSAALHPKFDCSSRPCNSWSVVTLQLPTVLHVECNCFPKN